MDTFKPPYGDAKISTMSIISVTANKDSFLSLRVSHNADRPRWGMGDGPPTHYTREARDKDLKFVVEKSGSSFTIVALIYSGWWVESRWNLNQSFFRNYARDFFNVQALMTKKSGHNKSVLETFLPIGVCEVVAGYMINLDHCSVSNTNKVTMSRYFKGQATCNGETAQANEIKWRKRAALANERKSAKAALRMKNKDARSVQKIEKKKRKREERTRETQKKQQKRQKISKSSK